MKHKGFNYRHAAQLIRPDLLTNLPPRCPQPGEQAYLWDEDDQRQREASRRAARLRTARGRRTR